MSVSAIQDKLSNYQAQFLGILRIVSAYIFMLHGTAKLFGLPYVEMFNGLPVLSMYGISGVLEFVGGLLLLIGFKSRFVAFIISGEMAAAYFIGHAFSPAGSIFLPVLNGGDAAILYTFVFLYIVFAGPGSWSLDGLLKKTK